MYEPLPPPAVLLDSTRVMYLSHALETIQHTTVECTRYMYLQEACMYVYRYEVFYSGIYEIYYMHAQGGCRYQQQMH